MQQLIRTLLIILLAVLAFQSGSVSCAFELGQAFERLQVPEGKSGLYVLEKGEEALLARAWLADNAQESITVQYFIWSVDNIGVLAAEALLRAAERGVHVRVIVDDLLMDAPPASLVALAAHPEVEIRIYNPVHKTGVSRIERIFNVVTDFRNVNQRMHDKTFVVDGRFAITGGRNMADEYFDYDHEYNFRDRDILVVGGVVDQISRNFDAFWESGLAKPVESLLTFQKLFTDEEEIGRIRKQLHAYADDPANFAPPVRQALAEIDAVIPAFVNGIVWSDARFLFDIPGKNDGRSGLAGGGVITSGLADVVRGARKSVLIQSPYLVMPEGAIELFGELVAKGVEVKISTNSLASTDNLMAFSGYRKQRKEILASGVEVYEFKPYPEIQQELVERYPELAENSPVFAIHAKTMVVDGETLYVGTFNLDPRSANLNTEVGIVTENRVLAAKVAESILRDMEPGNSWRAGVDKPDRQAPFGKRLRLRIWRLLPLDALL